MRPCRVLTQEDLLKMAELRARGLSYQAVARLLDIHTSRVHRVLNTPEGKQTLQAARLRVRAMLQGDQGTDTRPPAPPEGPRSRATLSPVAPPWPGKHLQPQGPTMDGWQPAEPPENPHLTRLRNLPREGQ